LLDAFTDLKNPNFAKLAEAIGYQAWRVERNEELEVALKLLLSHPGPALLDVKVSRMELVMPPKIEAAQVAGTALYSVKAILDGRARDVVELVQNNFLR
jgi:pyruvate dehydrogenase (quinone)